MTSPSQIEAPSRGLRERLKKGAVSLAEILLAVAVFLGAASVLTWPAIQHLDEVIIGGGELGGWIWRYWWHSLELDALGASEMGLKDRLFTFLSLGRYPETGNILDILFLSFPLQQFFELPAHYNIKIFLILVIDGLCGYALARRLTTSRAAALAAGCVALVNPLVIQDLYGSGLRQVLLWWVLLLPALLDRAEKIERPGAGILAGLCLGLVAAFYWFYGLFIGMFLGLWVVDFLFRRRGDFQWRAVARWSVPLLVTAGVVTAAFVSPYLFGGSTEGAEGGSALPELTWFLPFPPYDAIREAPLRPSNYAENVLSSLNRTVVSSWSLDYLWRPDYFRALPPIVFWGGVLPAIFVVWRRSDRRSNFWLVVFVVFFLGSLGPFLKVGQGGGELVSFQLPWQESEEALIFRLPYTGMFRWIPGMSRMFGPYRLASIVIVASVALVALGIGRIPDRIRGRRVGGVVRGGVAIVAIVTTILQPSYRWDLGPMAPGSIAPTRWRSAINVSAMRLPAWYRTLDPDEPAGLIELPLEQQQDLLCTYQTHHHWKVYRSWATPPAVPPAFRRGGGGSAGEQLRYLAAQDQYGREAGEVLMRLSRTPLEVDVAEDLDEQEMKHLVAGGDYRHLVIHERGFYLVEPLQGSILYRDVVRKLGLWLEQEPEEFVELKWFDYPGNRYSVPGGPVYVPWASHEVNLPDWDMPKQYFMAVFDLQPLLEDYDGARPSSSDTPAAPPVHEEIEHEMVVPGEEQ